MTATTSNSKVVLSICVAYTSTDEIVHSIQESCQEKWDELKLLEESGVGYGLIGLGANEMNQGDNIISVTDVEKHMHIAVTPDPDILIRTSDKTRLSNFLLWPHCHLYAGDGFINAVVKRIRINKIE
ncbi:Dehydrodolichyl diphosphate synthase 6 [Camellia lanceoleosa]|uniref:Dehydrodolichyl diphosphate synthase 6 n=1 Tax=Camellia lanceoleosa TaxID=1840588 RepID=A0ACC0HT35_9ERIC|nr:Dehydrodolichyl diphosphate synthase 6 [Camellia lanceoleosa]